MQELAPIRSAAPLLPPQASGAVAGDPPRESSASIDTRPVTIIRPPSFSVMALFAAAGRLGRYRDLLYTLSLHRLHVRYKQSVLGPLWAVLQPLSMMLIYFAVFWRMAGIRTEGPYPLFAYAALLPWTCFSTAVSSATNSLVSHFNLVTKVYFPREILPLTYVIAALVDLAAGALVLGVLMIYYQVPLTANALHVVPTLLVLATFSLAVSLILSAVQVRYRDIGIAIPLVLQLWMFATPVVYPLSAVPAGWRGLYILNPMVGVIEGFRRALVQGAPPHYQALAISALVSLILLPLAFMYFKHVESTVADVI
jgi:lipopolysaccharide transport system permease protein